MTRRRLPTAHRWASACGHSPVDIGASAGSIAVANSTASAVFGNSLIVNRTRGGGKVSSRNHQRYVDQRSAGVRHVARRPQPGGKIAFAPGSHQPPDNPGIFTHIPDMTTLVNPGLNEQFGILVSEETPFDTF